MALTNHDRVGKALDLLKRGLAPFIELEVNAHVKSRGMTESILRFADDPNLKDRPISEWDAAALLRMMTDAWNEVFRQTLGHAERSQASELREYRNKWAHQEPFSSDDADRALDSAERLLSAVSAAAEADEVRKLKVELRRLVFEEQSRAERRKTTSAIESRATGTLKPWREVVNPHRDVASGRYQQAEFAADLWQVHLGEGSAEYRDPVEFFRRTYLTESLRGLLSNAIRRLSGDGGDPVVQLQTNFGGGKTHSMLALYHLFSGASPSDLDGIESLMKEVEIDRIPKANTVVLVGNKISPGNPVTKDDGTVVNTLWGELAWQLGGRAAYERIRADDERATNPGDKLRELMNEYGPCLILIDEWVAYARQLHDDIELPGGNFETHFTFAQALTESAKLAQECLLVISIPASDTAGSPHTRADDIEVGGERGRRALDRLRNAVGRIEASWRPASAEEGFEIVRRRLFEPLLDREQYGARDTVARAFFDLYRTQHQEFPAECRDSEYEKRLRAAYPIHPEVFDRLYTDWSTLVKFQRTRGVLRLMAAVIHSLWEKGDRNPVILPANIPIDDPRVQSELTRYLPDNWAPVIEKDVDGPNALPLEIDGEVPNLGKFHATRRVARTIYLGSAPTVGAANRGLEDRRIKLGCVMPGETTAVFGDALRRLAASATYLYQDGARFWYSTQPTVTKLADDRAEQLKRNKDVVVQEIERRVREDVTRQKGDFPRIHTFPAATHDVPDDSDARLVILQPDQAYSKDQDNAALAAATSILESRGNAPRLLRNTLVFLAADLTRFQDLDEVVRKYLAWESILAESETLDLSPHQVKQAKAQLRSADSAVDARLPETYQWLLVPVQNEPKAPLTWETNRLTGQDSLAARASKRLKSEELLITSLGSTRLRMELDKVPLWRGDHVEIKLLLEDFARYPYLPRLRNSQVLIDGISSGFALLTWHKDTYAYAERYDEEADRYLGLRGGEQVHIGDGSTGLLVRPARAVTQIEEDQATAAVPANGSSVGRTRPPGTLFETDEEHDEEIDSTTIAEKKPRRYYGTVELDSDRVGRDASRIAEEVIAHLGGLVGARVRVTLEVEAEIPDGAPDHVVRTVTENAQTLKFESQGFEEE